MNFKQLHLFGAVKNVKSGFENSFDFLRRKSQGKDQQKQKIEKTKIFFLKIFKTKIEI
jgi:hypothetical protein